MKKIYGFLFLLLISATVRGQSINGGEYFFDADPGVGNGIPIGVSASDTVNFSVTIPSTGLGSGFHTLFVRTRNTNGKWSLQAGQTFFIQPLQNVLPAPPLAALEYFFDNDPGVGNGIPVSSPTGNTQDISVILPTTGLASGFHTLHFRSIDTDGTWGLFDSRSFYIQGTGPGVAPMLSSLEYFFDTDPGPGNGTPIPFNAADTTNIAFSAPTTGLSKGFHTLFIRKRNLDGTWGLFEGRPFYIQGETPANKPLVEIAWYFDHDSAFSTAHIQPLSPFVSDLDDVFTFTTDSLPDGIHIIFVRVKDSLGVWSFARRDTFQVGDCGPIPTPVITAIGNDSLKADVTGISYHWYRNGTLTNLTTQKILAPASGIYEAEVLTSEFCISEKSAPFEYWLTGLEDLPAASFAEVFPNPFSETLTMITYQKSITAIELLDPTGRLVRKQYLTLNPGKSETLNVADLAAGVYILVLKNENMGYQAVFRVLKFNP
ncbi:MAG: T9SS type A sorting domain-containing protein [Bacteroidia bacterium]